MDVGCGSEGANSFLTLVQRSHSIELKRYRVFQGLPDPAWRRHALRLTDNAVSAPSRVYFYWLRKVPGTGEAATSSLKSHGIRYFSSNLRHGNPKIASLSHSLVAWLTRACAVRQLFLVRAQGGCAHTIDVGTALRRQDMSISARVPALSNLSATAQTGRRRRETQRFAMGEI
jgi:hypothetical protein